MRKLFSFALACSITLGSTLASSEPQRRSSSNRTATAAERSAAELKTGRERVAAEIKTLTHFLYLLGGIAKGIELAGPATATNTAQGVSSSAVDQNERSKAKIKDSLKNVREGLEKLETDVSAIAAMKKYYRSIAGVANIGEAAERQAAANHFDESGRLLLKAVDQLSDALAAMR